MVRRQRAAVSGEDRHVVETGRISLVIVGAMAGRPFNFAGPFLSGVCHEKNLLRATFESMPATYLVDT
jgi:hypothetical protein